MMTPTKSSVVLVAGSALMDLQGVMDKIDSLAKDMKMTPYVVILIIRDNDIVPETVRHDMSPPVVSLLDSKCESHTCTLLCDYLSTGEGPYGQSWIPQLNIYLHLPRCICQVYTVGTDEGELQTCEGCLSGGTD